MINWSKLKPYQNDQRRSFEELCYQIAKGLYGEMGQFTSVDDSGGGDGVEFYLTLPNGDEWGWQAKFYYPQPRLSESSRKQSIIKSLETACQKHPNLKKWVLCTPTNFTPAEQKWFEETLSHSVPEIEIEHWGDSDFNNWLSEPGFSGKLNYFFNELELDMNWFKRQFDKQMVGVGDKFDSCLHIKTKVDAEIHALLGDKAFVHQITKWIKELEEELLDLKDAINDLNSSILYIEWDEEEKSKVIEAAESLQDVLINMKVLLKHVADLLVEKEFSEVQSMDWKSELDRLYETFEVYRKVERESGISKMKCTAKQESEEQVLHRARRIVDGPYYLVAELLDKFFPTVIWQFGLINESDLHILGDAGIGKTHIACNICADRLKNGLPALFVRGNLFTTEQPIETQLRTILDLPPSYSWHDFVKALSAAAEAYHTRIPLIIDGLNESVHNGTFSKVWELGLKGLVKEITQTKNLVLITTCRTSYKEAIWKEINPREDIIRGKVIWKDKDSLTLVYAFGFDTDEVKQEAIDQYFNVYKIKADLTLAPLMQFEHPLHLKIFCEAKNRERKTEKQVYVGEQMLFEVFEEYLSQCNQAVCERLDLHPKTIIVQSALNKMAAYLWQHRSREIPFEKLTPIVDAQSREHLDWPSSKTRAIESEGLLVYRDWADVGEVMHFTYDLLGGYLIARHLVEQAADNVQEFLDSEEIVALLFGEDHRILHPMYEDICRCLAALLPAKTGHFLHEFSDNKKAFGLSIRALFEISPEDINRDCIELVTYLFDQYQENRDFFFKSAETTIRHPAHPFNASFWSERFSALSMPERDLSWTEHVRKNRESFEKKVIRFEEICQRDQELSDTDKERLHLLAEHIMWIHTSTVRPLRDKATQALYWYGRRFPQEFLDLVMKSFTINDPYVSERMLAATYGIAMARQHDFKDTSFVIKVLPVYARKLYETMFKPNAPHSTTHILARDYAKRTIDIALMHHLDLLTEGERERITSPFTDGGIREWGECNDGDAGPYQTGAAPLQMDFGNYTLGRLVKDRGIYNFEHPEYQRVRANIFWRIYNLGYSLDTFGDIDSRLSEENYRKYGRSANGGKTDRYGKKYTWIAFYELAGFRQDNNLLPDYDDKLRISDADIDPSFPNKQREYNLVREGFLGDPEIPAKDWIFNTAPPDLTSYLKVDQFCDEEGPWVLLWGSSSQEDKKDNRDMFASLQGLIVKSEETKEIVKTLMNQETIDRDNMPFCPADYYTYAGEVPWCDTYPENRTEEIQFEIGKVLVSKKQVELLRNGKPIPWDEAYKFLDSITNLIEKDDEETLNSLFREQNLDITSETVETEEPEYQTFKVLVPVRENNWEAYHSAIIPSRSVEIPSRQIVDMLGLCGQPQSFDLFEKENGKRASITFRYGKEWGAMQHFTYLRQDLLERYLAEIDRELIWVIWGERRQVSQNPGAPYKYFHEVKTYRDITNTFSK